MAIGGRPGAYREHDRSWKAFFEVAAEEDRAGTDRPWQYMPTRWRDQVWIEVFGPRPSAARGPEVGRRVQQRYRRQIAEQQAEAEQRAQQRRAETEQEVSAVWR